METAERLSPEIIVHILKYLTFKDRKNIALVNKSWYHASMDPMFIKHELLFFKFVHNPGVPGRTNITNQLNGFIEMVLESKRKILHLKLTQTSRLQYLTPVLFSKRGPDIKSLSLIRDEFVGRNNYYNLSETYLTIIMSFCQNLDTLEIIGSRIKDCLLQHTYTTEICNPQNLFKSLKHLYLINSIISEEGFKLLTKHAPNLGSLYMKRVFVKSDVPDTNSVTRTLRVEDTCLNIMNYLKTAQKITVLDVDVINLSMKIPAHITLNSFKISGMGINCDDETYVNDFKLNLEIHKYSLEKLEIRNIPCCLLAVVKVLQNLKHLTIRNITSSSFCANNNQCLISFVNSLSHLKHLKELTLRSNNYEYAMFVIPQSTISSLTLLNCSLTNIKDVCKYGKHLTRLTMFKCFVTSSDLVNICTNLLNLRYLKVFHYNSIRGYNMIPHIPLSNLKDLSTLIITFGNFNHDVLRSINHTNLKILIIGKITLPSHNGSIAREDWSEFEESLKMLAISVPDLTFLRIYLYNVVPSWYDDREIKSHFNILDVLEIKELVY